MADETLTIGKSEHRKDAWDKVTGAAKYVADIPMDGYSHGAIVRSPHHYARIVNINKDSMNTVKTSIPDFFNQHLAVFSLD